MRNNIPTQAQMLEMARRRTADCDSVWLEVMNGSNPLTRSELAALIARRPEIWRRYEHYLETLPEAY